MERVISTKRQANREKMHTAYLYCEGTVKVILAALVKLHDYEKIGLSPSDVEQLLDMEDYK